MLYCLEIGFIVPNMEIRFCFWKKLTRNGSWETEVGGQKTGDCRLKTGNRSRKTEVRSRKTEDRRLETGVGSWKSGVREQETVY